jgi:curved DNA-binding protein CbpA
MKLDSKLFDRIRIRPEVDETAADGQPKCEWAGCEHPATHPAPKGRGQERDYWHFCLDHVRLYNKSYNYFTGMDDDAVARFQKDAATGHRPTKPIGVNARSWNRSTAGYEAGTGWAGGARGAQDGPQEGPQDGPTGAFAYFTRRQFRAEAVSEPPRRRLRNLERRSLEVLDLDEDAGPQDIRSRFKELVKRHHPDANGGDRSREGRLQQIIEAYQYLKTAGFC